MLAKPSLSKTSRFVAGAILMRRALDHRVLVARFLVAAALVAVFAAFAAPPAIADPSGHGRGRSDEWRGHDRREHHGRSWREREWWGHRPSAHYGGPGYYLGPGYVYPPLAAFYPPPAPLYYPPAAATYYPPPIDYAPPVAANSSPSTAPCRQARHTVIIDGKPQVLVGTLCKGPDGDWHVAP
jgi:hypothetical protein